MKIKQKSKLKTFKTASIVFFILALIYLGVWHFAKSIINSDKICYADGCFIVEIASTDEERQQGLMYREAMSSNRGMLFIFDEQKKHSFWMKNTIIPLDMIRIDSNNYIVDIQTAQPCDKKVCSTYVPKGDATYVLEINAGAAKDKAILVGDKLEFKLK